MSAIQPYTVQRVDPYPRLYRSRKDKVLAGVAGGLAEHFHLETRVLRVVIVASVLLGGVGLPIYALLWMMTQPKPYSYQPEGSTKALLQAPNQAALPGRPEVAEPTGLGQEVQPLEPKVFVPEKNGVSHGSRLGWLIIGALALGTGNALIGITGGLARFGLAPLVLLAAGAWAAWSAYDMGSTRDKLTKNALLFGGLSAILGSVVLFTAPWYGPGFHGVMVSLSVVLLSIVGVALVAIPPALRMRDSFAEEQAAKAAADERAEIASHLHDSVLQTLTLIQKRSDDQREVVRLARRQERELRQWLFEPEEKHRTTIFGTVEQACAEVESLTGLSLTPVTVGTDSLITENTQAAILAAREAMMNAAKHAGVDSADVYAEIIAGEFGIYVRDRGCGFDPEEIPDDRHGLRDSVHERVEKIGGTVEINSTLGEGTEVEIRVPVS